jgi:putative PIG3 family NAD(P)H quinone oxidoreductase
MPTWGATDVLIKVAAAGVNRPDVMQRKGWYPPPPGASDIPGLEVAGTIEQVGGDVAGWRVGDQVCALVSGGGYAEYCSAPAPQCLPVPTGLNFTQAAALPETTFTVWTNMFERAHLTSGETVLIHGGTSGIGTTAIQLASAFGARVLVTAGSEEKCAACLALGADLAFNYHQVDWVAAAKGATGGRGVDVVIDIVGGDYFQKNLEVLGPDGRLSLIGHLKGPKSQINSVPMFTKRLTITASTLRPRSVAEKGLLAQAIRERVWPLVEAGRVQVPVHATFPLAHAADAHRMMEESTHIGKIVLLN